MGRFAVVRERSCRSLEKAGRFRVEGENILIYLDGIGSYQVGRAQVISVLLRLGEEVIRERLYVAPVRRVKRVLEGKEKKGAVFGG